MPIEFRCQACGKQLRTPDNSGGKQGKCPHCQAVMQIPLPPSPAGTGGGNLFDSAAGSVKSTSSPNDLFGNFGSPPPTSPQNNPFAESSNPYAPPQKSAAAYGGGGGGGVVNDNSGLILGLGITSVTLGGISIFFFCCCALIGIPAALIGIGTGLPAIFMGNSYFHRVPPHLQSGNAKAGWVCGIIGVTLSLLSGTITVVVLVLNIGSMVMNSPPNF